MSTKKSAKAQKEAEAVTYSFGDVVLGKVRGFPAWPGQIVDPDTVPPAVVKERPPAKNAKFYSVQFFPTAEYAWLVAKDISRLQKHEIEAYLADPPKKKPELIDGYRVALDPQKWREEREAILEAAAEEENNAPVDQLEESEDEVGDDEEGGKKKAKAKKRKRDSEGASASAAKKKKAGDGAAKAKKTAGEKKAPAKKGKKPKSNKMVESEDDDAEAEEDPAVKVPEPAKKKGDDEDDSELAKDPEAKKVREWRHKLQRTFLSNNKTASPDEMPVMDELFTTVEQYDNMTIQYLSFSKIGKVMRHIAQQSPDKLPRDDEFKFRDRALKLVDRWQNVINPGKTSEKETVSAMVNGSGGEKANGVIEEAMNGDLSVMQDVSMAEM